MYQLSLLENGMSSFPTSKEEMNFQGVTTEGGIPSFPTTRTASLPVVRYTVFVIKNYVVFRES